MPSRLSLLHLITVQLTPRTSNTCSGLSLHKEKPINGTQHKRENNNSDNDYYEILQIHKPITDCKKNCLRSQEPPELKNEKCHKPSQSGGVKHAEKRPSPRVGFLFDGDNGCDAGKID